MFSSKQNYHKLYCLKSVSCEYIFGAKVTETKKQASRAETPMRKQKSLRGQMLVLYLATTPTFDRWRIDAKQGHFNGNLTLNNERNHTIGTRRVSDVMAT